MAYIEKNMQSRFSKWIRTERLAGRHLYSCAWELKVVKNNKLLALSNFQPQQLPKLWEAKHGCVYKKLSDADRSLKPYDAQQICYAKAYVVVEFYKPRKPHIMYWIDIDVFLKELEKQKRKSLTEQMIIPISEKYEF